MPTAPGPISLPNAWPAQVRSALVHAFALAHLGIVHVHGWCVNSRIARVRLAADNERMKAEVAVLREELRIKDARMARIPARERGRRFPLDRRFHLHTSGVPPPHVWSSTSTRLESW